MAGINNKILLFADDILLSITFPYTTLPTLLKVLYDLADFLGFRVNPAKSMAMNSTLLTIPLCSEPWTPS